MKDRCALFLQHAPKGDIAPRQFNQVETNLTTEGREIGTNQVTKADTQQKEPQESLRVIKAKVSTGRGLW